MVPEGIEILYPRGSKLYPRGTNWYPSGSKCYLSGSKCYLDGSKWHSRESNLRPRGANWYPKGSRGDQNGSRGDQNGRVKVNIKKHGSETVVQPVLNTHKMIIILSYMQDAGDASRIPAMTHTFYVPNYKNRCPLQMGPELSGSPKAKYIFPGYA